jgi:hypothetical protein
MRFYPSQASVAPLTSIRRRRLLPAPGEILVREGDRVDPVHVIGHAYVPGGFQIVNVAQHLEVPAHTVRRYLRVKGSQEVQRGDLLAVRRGLSRRVCRSPVDGVVVGGGGGWLLIESPPQAVEVRSNYYGTIARVLPNRGVIIQISGSLVEGAWGNGKQGYGVLRVMVGKPGEILEGRNVDASCRGVILVGGSSLDRATLEQGIELQARGIITGGVPPELVEEVAGLPFPMVATEGIGIIPMSSHVFQMVSTHDGREAILDARFQSRWETQRPEIIIPLPAEPGTDRLKPRDVPLQTGDRVRATRLPHAGQTGTVVELPVTPARIPTGAFLRAAKVQPDDGGEPLLIPVVNLEVLR